MKKSIVFINKNFYIFNGERYDFDRFNEIRVLLKSNTKIIILEEELFVKQFKNNMKRHKLYEFVDYNIKNDFPQNGDMLYDFEKKKNDIAIYSIKGAIRVERLLKKVKNVEIKPIQFIIKEVMMKIIKKNVLDFKVLVRYEKYYYYLSVKDGLYYDGFISENKDEIINKLLKNNYFCEIYTDNNTTEFFLDNYNFKVREVNIGELINETIYEKQRFYSRKVL